MQQHFAARALCAGDIDHTRVLNALRLNVHLTALRDTLGLNRAGASELHFAALQQDAAALPRQTAGIELPAVDDLPGQGIQGGGAEDDQTIGRLHRGFVLHQGGHQAGTDRDAGKFAGRVEVEFHGLGTGHDDRALLGHDQSFVAHLRRQQRHVTTECGAYGAFIDDRAGGPVARKLRLARHEVGIALAHRGGRQRAHIEHRVFAKVHAGGVDQGHLSGRVDAAKNLTRVGIAHTVQGGRLRVGLVEVDGTR